MRLQLMTWPEVEDYLKDSKGVVIPIGSTEQHGPTGFVGTDALCPEMIAWELGRRHGVMVAPTLSIGMAQHHLGFPGSVTLRPSTLMAVVQDVVNSLARHGFERFFFLNGHGGNISTLSASFSELYAEQSLGTAGRNRPDIRCTCVSWFLLKGVQEIAREAFGDKEGGHATCSEVSLTYFGYPEDGARVWRETLEPEVAGEGPIFDADDFRRRYPDGRMGSAPQLATAAIGERLFEAAVEEAVGRYREFLDAA